MRVRAHTIFYDSHLCVTLNWNAIHPLSQITLNLLCPNELMNKQDMGTPENAIKLPAKGTAINKRCQSMKLLAVRIFKRSTVCTTNTIYDPAWS
jgi:hypothetical protein